MSFTGGAFCKAERERGERGEEKPTANATLTHETKQEKSPGSPLLRMRSALVPRWLLTLKVIKAKTTKVVQSYVVF